MSRGERRSPPLSSGSLIQTLQNNIVVIAVGIAAAVAGTVYGVTSYFQGQQIQSISAIHNLEIQQIKQQFKNDLNTLELKISSIDRRLGNEKYLDIQKFFKPQTTKPDDLMYISDANFFAPWDTEYWTYEKTDESKLMKEMTGDTSDILDPVVFQRMPIHLWRGKDEYNLTHETFKKLFSNIFVQVFSFEVIPDLTKMVVERYQKDEGKPEKSESDTVELTKTLNTYFQTDAAGFFLTSTLKAMFDATASDPSLKFVIRNIQKVGRVLYGQFVLQFDQPTVNGAKMERLFWVQEVFLIDRVKDVVIVKTNAITNTPAFTGNYFDHINLWLGRFSLGDLR